VASIVNAIIFLAPISAFDQVNSIPHLLYLAAYPPDHLCLFRYLQRYVWRSWFSGGLMSIGFSRILISIDSKILCCCGSHLCHNRCSVKWTLYFFWINVTCFRWVMFSLTASLQSSFYVSTTQDKLEAGVRLSHYMHSYGDRPNDYESVSKC